MTDSACVDHVSVDLFGLLLDLLEVLNQPSVKHVVLLGLASIC